MSLDLTDDKSTLVQVMAWCRQATSHYLSQCWPRSLSPYGVTRPQWIKFVSTSCETPIRWMPQNTFDDKSTLYQVMGWHHQATSHYLSQCWPRPLLPYDIARHNELHFLCCLLRCGQQCWEEGQEIQGAETNVSEGLWEKGHPGERRVRTAWHGEYWGWQGFNSLASWEIML